MKLLSGAFRRVLVVEGGVLIAAEKPPDVVLASALLPPKAGAPACRISKSAEAYVICIASWRLCAVSEKKRTAMPNFEVLYRAIRERRLLLRPRRRGRRSVIFGERRGIIKAPGAALF